MIAFRAEALKKKKKKVFKLPGTSFKNKVAEVPPCHHQEFKIVHSKISNYANNKMLYQYTYGPYWCNVHHYLHEKKQETN